ncbi:MAG: hypothetical protein P8Z49_06680 [Acidobacteriota bacterium]
MKKSVKIADMAKKRREPLIHLENEELMPLPEPLDGPAKDHNWTPLSEQAREKYECILDDTCVVNIPRPQSKKEEDALVQKFLSGLEKLFTRESNWTFLQPLILTMEHCARCQTCSESCHIFEASGHNELYRPTYRSEILRRLYFKHIKKGVFPPLPLFIVLLLPALRGRYRSYGSMLSLTTREFMPVEEPTFIWSMEPFS